MHDSIHQNFCNDFCQQFSAFLTLFIKSAETKALKIMSQSGFHLMWLSHSWKYSYVMILNNNNNNNWLLTKPWNNCCYIFKNLSPSLHYQSGPSPPACSGSQAGYVPRWRWVLGSSQSPLKEGLPATAVHISCRPYRAQLETRQRVS